MPNHALKHDLASMYLSRALLGAHRIHLKLQDTSLGHHKGQMSLDPNMCSLNVWGDPMGCTRIAIRSVNVQTTAMRLHDDAGHNRILHEMKIEGMADAKVHLIEYPKANLFYLVEEDPKNGTVVAPLFQASLFGFDAAGTIGTRYGVPIRHVIARGDAAEMRAEAAIVRRALAEVDAAGSERMGLTGDSKVAEVRSALAELEAALTKLEG
ncbi:MAG: hypothetical protein U1A78_35545 [Polyangia bacterium]